MQSKSAVNSVKQYWGFKIYLKKLCKKFEAEFEAEP